MGNERVNQPQDIEVDFGKLNAALSGKIRGCPLCGATNSFSAIPKIMELRQYYNGDFVVVGQSSIVPLVVLTCSNCGNTVLINAIASGLLSSTPGNQVKQED